MPSPNSSLFLLLSVVAMLPVSDACFGQSGSSNKNSTQRPSQPFSTPDEAGNAEEATADYSDRPVYQKYLKAIEQRKLLTRQLDSIIGSAPIGFKNLQREHSQKIETLRLQKQQLDAIIGQLAIEAFIESPKSDPGLAQNAYRIMSTSLDPKTMGARFNPQLAFKLAKAFVENGHIDAKTQFLAFRAAYAISDYKTCENMLNGIEAAGAVLNGPIRERMNSTKEKWDRELEIRRMEAATDDLPRVKIETTEGDIVVELFENHAPDTVGNFVNLVEKGFFDNLSFHIVIPGVLSQSGCPKGDSTGHPGYRIPCECYREQIRHHFAGTISMSNKGKDTGGSQFYISHQPNPKLDGKYTVFGRVIEGLDVVYKIKRVDRPRTVVSASQRSFIRKASVLRKRDHDYVPNILETVDENSPTPEIGEIPQDGTGDSSSSGSGSRGNSESSQSGTQATGSQGSQPRTPDPGAGG